MQNACPFVKTRAAGGSEAGQPLPEQGVEQCCFLRGTPEVMEPSEPGVEGSGPFCCRVKSFGLNQLPRADLRVHTGLGGSLQSCRGLTSFHHVPKPGRWAGARW